MNGKILDQPSLQYSPQGRWGLCSSMSYFLALLEIYVRISMGQNKKNKVLVKCLNVKRLRLQQNFMYLGSWN